MDPTSANARKVMHAFKVFVIPMTGMTVDDFATPGTQFNTGVAPCEIDFLGTIPGLDFESALANKVVSMGNDFPIDYLGRADLMLAMG